MEIQIGQKFTIKDLYGDEFEVEIKEIEDEIVYFEAPGIYGTIFKKEIQN